MHIQDKDVRGVQTRTALAAGKVQHADFCFLFVLLHFWIINKNCARCAWCYNFVNSLTRPWTLATPMAFASELCLSHYAASSPMRYGVSANACFSDNLSDHLIFSQILVSCCTWWLHACWWTHLVLYLWHVFCRWLAKRPWALSSKAFATVWLPSITVRCVYSN